MIIRLTKKLAKKISVPTLQDLPLDKNPFADWSANLFTVQRVQYIIITNTLSLYSMVMYGRGITDHNKFIQSVVSSMRDFMLLDDNEFIYRRFIEPGIYNVMFAKSLNRAVTGSMNDLISQSKFHQEEGDMSPIDTSFKLNETLMSYLNNVHPWKIFRAMNWEKGASI